MDRQNDLMKSEDVEELNLRKRQNLSNQQTTKELEKSGFSESAKKPKIVKECSVPDNNAEYRILNFVAVFAAVSTFVRCKKCKGDVQFQATKTLGLGFTIELTCTKCEPRHIPSSPLIRDSYEINRRFICAMKILDLGLQAIKRFCSMMNIPETFHLDMYDTIVNYIADCVEKIDVALFKKQESTVPETEMSTESKLTSVIDVCMFKEGFKAFVKILQSVGVSMDSDPYEYKNPLPSPRVHGSEK